VPASKPRAFTAPRIVAQLVPFQCNRPQIGD